MKLIRKVVPSSFNYFLFGDLHVGTTLHYEEGVDKLIEMMNSSYGGLSSGRNYGLNHGDNIEAISIDDKRFDEDTVDPELSKPRLQAKYVIEKLKPIKKKIITVLEGNHERKLIRNFGDMSKEIAEDLDVPFGTYTSIITFVDKNGKLLFKHYASHGAGTINTTADDPVRQESNMQLSLKRKLKNKAGDCVLMSMGHTHKLLMSEPKQKLYIVSDGLGTHQKYTGAEHTDTYIHPDHRWYVNTGSFFKIYGDDVSGYAERFGYDPLELGFQIVKVRNRQIVAIDKIVV